MAGIWGAPRIDSGYAGAEERVVVATTWDADDAVTALYSAHYASLVRMAAMLLRSTAEAEEVVQDAFVAMHGRWKRLRNTDNALSYLRRSVVNTARSRLRRRSVEGRYRPEPAHDAPSAEHVALDSHQHSAVFHALKTLTVRQREAVVLRYYLDLSEAETASVMNVSRGAVKSHTSRGLLALRTALER